MTTRSAACSARLSSGPAFPSEQKSSAPIKGEEKANIIGSLKPALPDRRDDDNPLNRDRPGESTNHWETGCSQPHGTKRETRKEWGTSGPASDTSTWPPPGRSRTDRESGGSHLSRSGCSVGDPFGFGSSALAAHSAAASGGVWRRHEGTDSSIGPTAHSGTLTRRRPQPELAQETEQPTLLSSFRAMAVAKQKRMTALAKLCPSNRRCHAESVF